MKRLDLLHLHLRSSTPSISKWNRDGVYLIRGRFKLNITDMFNDSPDDTIDLLKDYMDRDMCVKHKLQLTEVFQFFHQKYIEMKNEIYG